MKVPIVQVLQGAQEAAGAGGAAGDSVQLAACMVV